MNKALKAVGLTAGAAAMPMLVWASHNALDPETRNAIEVVNNHVGQVCLDAGNKQPDCMEFIYKEGARVGKLVAEICLERTQESLELRKCLNDEVMMELKKTSKDYVKRAKEPMGPTI